MISQIQIIDGMEEGSIAQALNDKNVGTIIYKE
jgi:isopentenyl phosphate kinase